VTKGKSRRRGELGHMPTINGGSVEHHLGQVPDERLDQFLQFIARLIVRDFRNYPELPIDKVIIDEPAIDDHSPRCTKTSTNPST